jgi:predicted dehydrogenase
MSSLLRAGVIGAGVFGGYHAAKYADLSDVTLTAVLDRHPERAAAITGRFGGRPTTGVAEFLDLVDVVSVAAPAIAHGGLALAVLRAGKSVYVEKPIATSMDDADAIVAEAARRGLTVACGFLERAAFHAMGLFDLPRAPLRMETVRLGPPSPRNLDVSVVVDLMIHDLDLALALTDAEALTVEADGAAIRNTLLDDVAAEVTFEDGFVASLRASRVAAGRERTMTLTYPSGALSLDFITHAFDNATGFALNADYEETPEARDRLGASLAAFLAAVRGDAPAPMADAAAGARALDLALAVEQAVGG